MTLATEERLEHRAEGELAPSPLNPRGPVVEDDELRDLADSIRAQGILQPLVVTRNGTVIAGHRRHAAARLAGLTHVPCIVRDLTPGQQLAVMLVENLQRRSLSPMQQAQGVGRLRDTGLSPAEIAARVGRHRSWVDGMLRLLALPEDLQAEIGADRLPLWTGVALARFADRPAVLRRVVDDVRRYGMSAAMVQSLNDDGERPKLRNRSAREPGEYLPAFDPAHPDLSDLPQDEREKEIRVHERGLIAEWLRERAARATDRAIRTELYAAAKHIDEGAHRGTP